MEDEEDELLRVTQRFSQTPNRVRHKPSHDESRLSQDSTLSQNSTPITDGDKCECFLPVVIVLLEHLAALSLGLLSQ